MPVISKFDPPSRPRPCWCTGYWFPHRKGGGACEHSPTRDIHLARRVKDKEAEITAVIEHAYDNSRASTEPCPF